MAQATKKRKPVSKQSLTKMTSLKPPTPLSIALGKAIYELQKQQYQSPDEETEELLNHIAEYQEKLVMGRYELPATFEQVKQAA
ncbi:MAG: hypothetical protein WA865_11490 [Spirulinaceae cyanobacterium]